MHKGIILRNGIFLPKRERHPVNVYNDSDFLL